MLGPDAAVAVTDMNLPILVAHLLNQPGGDRAQAARLLDVVLAITAPAPGQRSPNDWRIARVKVFAERGQTDAALNELEGAIKQGWRTPWLFDDAVRLNLAQRR